MVLPNFKHLHYLLALYKHQHFNRAAQACFVSQSTLSSAILKLEEQLGCQLIERDHKAFIFTAHGEAIVKMSQHLILSANEMVDFAKQQGGSATGSIRIGCIPTIAPYLLTDVVNACSKELPNLSLYLTEETTENLTAMLSQGEIDIAILAFPTPHSGFKSKVLGQDAFYLAGDKNLVEEYIDNGDYQQFPPESIFLLEKDHCLTEHAVSACQLADKSKINPFSATSVATLVQMTAFHKGVTFLPEMAVKKGVGTLESLEIRPISKHVYREIGMLWRSTSMRQTTFTKLADIIKPLLT